MFGRNLYSQRNASQNAGQVDLKLLRDLFIEIYKMFYEKDYFRDSLGVTWYENGDAIQVDGELGTSKNISRSLVSQAPPSEAVASPVLLRRVFPRRRI